MVKRNTQHCIILISQLFSAFSSGWYLIPSTFCTCSCFDDWYNLCVFDMINVFFRNGYQGLYRSFTVPSKGERCGTLFPWIWQNQWHYAEERLWLCCKYWLVYTTWEHAAVITLKIPVLTGIGAPSPQPIPLWFIFCVWLCMWDKLSVSYWMQVDLHVQSTPDLSKWKGEKRWIRFNWLSLEPERWFYWNSLPLCISRVLGLQTSNCVGIDTCCKHWRNELICWVICSVAEQSFLVNFSPILQVAPH